MFIGHFGVGFAGKRAVPAVSLGTLFLAVQFADGLWPLLLLLGVEHVRIAPGTMKLSPFDFYDYPWSHRLVALVGWGALFGAAHFVLRRSLRAAAVAGRSREPLVPRLPGSPPRYAGLSSGAVPGPGTLELSCGDDPARGGVLRRRGGPLVTATRAKDRTGVWALWSLVLFLFALWVSMFFAPPPPGQIPVALSGIAMWLTIPWGYWIDRHRVVTTRLPATVRPVL